MTNEDRQRNLLMAQLAKKRALKQKYLRPQEGPGHPLTALVMTNVMLLAIKEKVDIFGVIRQLNLEAPPYGESSFDSVLGQIQALADALDRSVYELFIDDKARCRRILEKLLRDLSACDSWEDIRVDAQGNGSFALPGFDYAYRMAERPSATLLFEKTAVADTSHRYTLTLGDGQTAMSPIPGRAVLWQEAQGPLQEFTDRVLANFDSGWPALKEQFDLIGQQLLSRAETLRDLALLLDGSPVGINLAPLLKKEAETLKTLQEKYRTAYHQMPEKLKAGGKGTHAQSALLLLGGAVSALEGLLQAMPEAPRDQLNEIVYMLENAGGSI